MRSVIPQREPEITAFLQFSGRQPGRERQVPLAPLVCRFRLAPRNGVVAKDVYFLLHLVEAVVQNVTDTDEAHDAAFIDHGEMPNAALRHRLRDGDDAVLRTARNDGLCHQVPNRFLGNGRAVIGNPTSEIRAPR